MSTLTAESESPDEMTLDFSSNSARKLERVVFATTDAGFPYFVDGFDSIQAAGARHARLVRILRPLRSTAYESCKRAMDIALSLVGILLLSPIFILAAVMVKLYDRGPVFFTQDRVGKGGLTFRCFKFRSMVLNAEALQESLQSKSHHSDPRTFKIADDPRITPPGRLLRRFSIDELPQVFDVLMGHMSIVGPRPPMPHEVKLYTDHDLERLAVKPGLTCIWQVSGRSRLPFTEQVKLDIEYINRRSLLLDLSLILRTVPAVLTGDGAV